MVSFGGPDLSLLSIQYSMRKIIPLSLVLMYFLALWPHSGTASADELLSPGQIIAAINQYRAQNGLHTLQSNSILMSTAQDQSDYMASTGNISHTGPGGTSPRDRAYAAGYGDGQIIFMSEIIYGGSNATIDDAMAFWKSSPNHNPWMLSTNYVDIGAGITTNGGSVYFTAVMAYVAGGVAPTPGSGSEEPDEGDGSGGGVLVPVLISSPNADGAVIHIVQPGQTLVGIATAYAVTLADIYALNNLNEFSIIYPGDEIIIKDTLSQPTTTPTSTQLTPTATRTVSPTSPPAYTPSPQMLAGAAGVSSREQQEAQASNQAGSRDGSLRWVIIITVAGIFFIVMGGLLIPRRAEEIE